jgi:hypothetical protein
MHVDDELASYLVPGPFSIAVAGCNAESDSRALAWWTVRCARI